jgi:putative aminopeptidase FrvX
VLTGTISLAQLTPSNDAYTNTGSNNIFGTVFRNGGNDSFPFAANTDPTSFMVAELTGRGVVDLIGVSNSGLVIWPNNGSFGFPLPR